MASHLAQSGPLLGGLPCTLSMNFRQYRQVKMHLTNSLRTVILTCDDQTNVPQKYVIGVASKNKNSQEVYVCAPHELPTKISDLIKHRPTERYS